MWNKYLPMLYILLCITNSICKIEAQSQASASASAVAVAVSQVPEPPQPDPVIEALAQSILEGLLNSAVLGSAANFTIDHPYDVFYEPTYAVLDIVGIDDKSLATHVAEAVEGVAPLTSQLFFAATGYTMATILVETGKAIANNVDAMSLYIVNTIGVHACIDGVTDADSVVHAVVFGNYDVLNSFGLINKDDVVYFLNLFAAEITLLSGVY